MRSEVRAYIEQQTGVHYVDDIRVGSAEEAVARARDLKDAGDAQWFRGQRALWPISSTIHRSNHELAEAKLERFRQWCNATPLDITGPVDKLFAIAQHYGLPTHYVDFTTDPGVAGFFATEGQPIGGHEESCIILLNLEDAQGTFDAVRELGTDDPKLIPELVEIDVSNLWRLQAQQGVFLYLPALGLEEWCRPQRIVFPGSSRLDRPTRAEIYPVEKSDLEIQIHGFLANEIVRRRGAHALDCAKESGIPVLVFETFPYAEADVHKSALWQPCWSASRMEPWQYVPADHWDDVKPAKQYEIGGVGVDALEATVAAHVAAALESDSTLRRRLSPWRPAISGFPTSAREKIELTVSEVWAGVRVLPYSNLEVSKLMGRVVAYAAKRYEDREQPRFIADLAREMIPDAFEIEISDGRGRAAKCYVSKNELTDAVRADIGRVVRTTSTVNVDDIEDLLQIIPTPMFLFDFERLSGLFCTSIIPSQVAAREDGTPITPIYSPGRLDRLGLP